MASTASARKRDRYQSARATYGSVSIFAVVGFLAVGVFAILVLMSSIRMITLSDDIAQLKTDLGVLQKEEAKLRTQYELAFDQTTIEKNMTATGTMVKPQDGQILYLDLSAPDSVVLFQEEGRGQEGAGGPLAVVREILDNVKAYFG